MTDKQIIIDEMIEEIGFDVQQCGYLEIIEDAPNYPEIGDTYTAFECNLYCRDCKFIDDCRYKQLLRKEQECERLKVEKAEILKKTGQVETLQGYTVEDIHQLKTENEELKESCKNTSTSLYAFMDNCSELRYKIINLKNKYKKEITKQAKSILKLKQAIEKIKEIAQFACEKSVCDGNHCDYCSDGQIIAICDEVNNG